MKRTMQIAAVMTLSIAAGLALSGRIRAEIADEVYAKLDLFGDAMAIVQNHYVKEVDITELIYGAIEGMLAKLDAHSSFLPPRAFNEMQVETRGEFGGIGIEITVRDNWLTIVSPIEDTPASRAGLQAADRIVGISGKSTKDMPLEQAVDRLRGKIGTEVEISILRPTVKKVKDAEGNETEDVKWSDPFDVRLVRDKIRVRSVRHEEMEDGQLLYIRLMQFQQQTGNDLRAILDTNRVNDRKGLILDMRNNPGGLLDQAVEVADIFLNEGKIVYTDGREPAMHKEWFAKARGGEPTVPIVVLINGGTASASEIVAGALQDHDAATVMGSRSFGKGSVQTILRLRDGSGIRITTALYYTPNGRSIQAEGIVPDIEIVPQPELENLITREKDLERHLEFGEDGSPAVQKNGDSQESITERFQKRKDAIQNSEKPASDLVLDAAVDYLLQRGAYAADATSAATPAATVKAK